MTLFNFLKLMHSNPTEAIEKRELHSKHSFMVNRLMAIEYPTHATRLSYFNFDDTTVITFWVEVLRQYNRYPSFLYAKMGKTILDKDVEEYLSFKKYDSFTCNYLRANPSSIIEEVEKYKKMKEIR